ncbi:MAG: hypothetical protein IT180_01505 [Acidobacteria bacterium]|nr:hypothetical protein [Acidobacteriota bacterium]
MLVFAAGWVAVEVVGFPDGFRAPPPTHANPLLDLPARWDTGWYVGLASHGYRWDGVLGRFENLAFFPAYPFLLRLTATVFGVSRSNVAWNWVGVGLSTALFAVALWYLWRLVAEVVDQVSATRAMLFCACYPFAIYFGLPYTESLFLLCCVAATFYLWSGRFVNATVFGIVAGLTRPNGAILFLLLAGSLFTARERHRPPAERVAPALATLGPLLGVSVYCAFVYGLTGDPLSWVKAQEGWGRGFRSPVATASDFLTHLFSSPLRFAAESPELLVNGLAAGFVLLAAWPVGRRWGLGMAAFLVSGVMVPVVGGGLPSLGRYSSVLFPIYLWMASDLGDRVWRPVLAISLVAEAVVAGFFFIWRPLY